MSDITQSIIERGDLAHLALFLVGERRFCRCLSSRCANAPPPIAGFDEFVRELSHFNRRFGENK